MDSLTVTTAVKLVQRAKANIAACEAEARKGWLNYCVHGTYIGTPGGPDYMCHRCEAGETMLDIYADALAEAKRRVANMAELIAAANKLNAAGYLPDREVGRVLLTEFRKLDD